MVADVPVSEARDGERAELLVVCTGNVCRSPYLQRRLEHELGAVATLPPGGIASAGTRAVVGSDMAPESRELLHARQGPQEPFAARQLGRPMIERAHLVITMTRAQRTEVARVDPRSMAKTHVLLDLVRLIPRVAGPERDGSGHPIPWARWIESVASELAKARSTVPPLPEERSAVVDPIGRGRAAFEAMARQLEAVIPPLVELLTPVDARTTGVSVPS